MNYVSGQFVALPRITNLNTLKLKYTDILTYTALRSFDGDEGCFPSYESISARANCSRDFIITSIKRLERSGLISVKRTRKRLVRDRLPVNEYRFKHFDLFDPIPYDIFEATLTLHDKAMLLSLRQFFYDVKIRPLYSLARIAKELKLSTKVVQQRFRSLIELGYIVKLKVPRRNLRFSYKYELSSQVNWIWDRSKLNLTNGLGLLLRVS